MLNIGFNKVGLSSETVSNYHVNAPTDTNPVAKYATPVSNGALKYSSGAAGVQCGAFSSYETAKRQANKLQSVTGFTPDIEQNDGGLYRVRINTVSENTAQNIKNMAGANSIDCYIFH